MKFIFEGLYYSKEKIWPSNLENSKIYKKLYSNIKLN